MYGPVSNRARCNYTQESCLAVQARKHKVRRVAAERQGRDMKRPIAWHEKRLAKLYRNAGRHHVEAMRLLDEAAADFSMAHKYRTQIERAKHGKEEPYMGNFGWDREIEAAELEVKYGCPIMCCGCCLICFLVPLYLVGRLIWSLF